MKIKSLLLGMFACAGLAACTNEDILENDVKQPQSEELANVPAYITVSLSTANSSSRATVEGDGKGNVEDSYVGNAGTTDENDFKEIAVIIKTVGENGGNATNSGIATIIEISDEKVKTETVGNETTLTVKNAFKVLAGTHKVLTIVNPTEAIKTAVTEAADNYGEIGTLYDGLAKGNGLLSDYGLPYSGIGNCANAIMFVNRDEVTVEAKSTNSEGSPAVASVLLERPVAKIMYRKIKDNDSYPITITITKQAYNVVERKENGEITYYALVKDAADRIRAAKVTDVETETIEGGKEVVVGLSWSLVNELCQCYTYNNGTVGTELMTPVELKGTPQAIPDNEYYLLKDKDGKWILPEFIYTPYTEDLKGEKDGWKVELTEYALINLTNDSYVIRHTANELGTEVNTFGLLTGKNYIADPYFNEKNTAATTYDFANVDTWSDEKWTTWNTAAGKWFENTLKDVADETNGASLQPSFKSLNLSESTESTEPTEDDSELGKLLQYCFENGVMSHNQLHGLTTGIVFKGVVTGTGTNGEDLPAMYQYGTEVYIGLDEIIKAYGNGNDAIAALKDVNPDSEDGKRAIREAGIRIYQNNECYYYTNQIKHFDNGDNNVAGNMEFAIVRNNIYSLAVKNIKGIGDAAIDPNPGIENESAVGYIKVEAKIIPWIVRTNNIEF